MGKQPFAAVGGFGLALIMWILEIANIHIPLWLLVLLGVIALGMVVFGSIPIVTSAYRGTRYLRLRTPFVIARPQYIPKQATVAQEQTTEEIVAQEYSPKVRDTLDALIQRGNELCSKMQTKDFSIWHIEPMVGEWLDDVSRDVWEIIPEYANFIVGEQGELTADEQLRYDGWKWNAVSLRISVDRRLARLRDVRSRIRVSDTGDPQN